MTQFQAILAAIALVLWVAAYAWFFHSDVRNWLRWRAAMRKQDQETRREQVAQQAKLVEDLAQRYQLPPSGPGARA